MKTRFNKNGTVSIQQMPKDVYWAVCSILASSECTFEWNDEEENWWSNSDFLCSLSPEEKEAMDEVKWCI